VCARAARQGRLPQVAWLIAPARQCEHPDPSSPLQGAAYIAAVLDALTADPRVWARTALFINYDENDGFFDHVPPPAPPSRDAQGRLHGGSTVRLDGEYHEARGGPAHGSEDDPPPLYGRAYGLGPRVPMVVVSPWSRGGWVDSEVFDHTSVLRFLERRFGVAEPQISPWRRAVCGACARSMPRSRARPCGRRRSRRPQPRRCTSSAGFGPRAPCPMPWTWCRAGARVASICGCRS
jgi:phospholipase C